LIQLSLQRSSCGALDQRRESWFCATRRAPVEVSLIFIGDACNRDLTISASSNNQGYPAMTYEFMKFLHVIGAVLLVGNVTITAFWKVFADRTGDAQVVAYAQRLVTLCDWVFTLSGIVMIVIGGYGMAYVQGLNIFGNAWLILGQLFFIVSGLIWLFVLIPLQIRLAKQARVSGLSGSVAPAYWRDGRLWLIWGIIATIPLVGAIYVMIAKP
jgi:uncharacterized membrane protein